MKHWIFIKVSTRPNNQHNISYSTFTLFPASTQKKFYLVLLDVLVESLIQIIEK